MIAAPWHNDLKVTFGFGSGSAATKNLIGNFPHENQNENRPPLLHRQSERPEPVSPAGGAGEGEGVGEDRASDGCFLKCEVKPRITMSSVYITFKAIIDGNLSFADRIGPPDECTSALGHVTIGFSWLEQSLEDRIASLAKLSPELAPALTSELSFKVKVGVLSSLVRVEPPLRDFNHGFEDKFEVWNDIVRMLFECEAVRNKIVHSHWSLPTGNRIRRRKTTAKPKKGISISSEELSSKYLLDVYDYILNVEIALNEFFLE